MLKNTINSLIFAAELNSEHKPCLDLHGLTYDEAFYEIGDFLSREHARGKRKDYIVVKVITGSGTRRVKQALDDVLKQNNFSFIVHRAYQSYPLPSTAVSYVVLAPNIK